MTLPLRFSPFERYMLRDDRPSHPMTFTIRLKFAGSFDQPAFERAMLAAVERHPLLCARLAGDRPADFTWVASPDARPYLDVAPLDAPLRFPGAEQIDLRHYNGLRIWVRTGPDSTGIERTEMRFQFHHSCCDGLGAYRYIEDALACYHREVVPGEHPPLRPLDSTALARRARYGLTWWKLVLRLPAEIWGAVVGLVMFLLVRPRPLKTSQSPAPGSDDGLTLLDYPAYKFDVTTSHRLRDVAKGAGVTMNDLLLCELFRAMSRWNALQDPRAGGGNLRIMMPVSLRVPGDEQTPAANIVAMVNLDRNLTIYKNPRLLLKTIQLETRFLQYFRFGLAFIRCITFFGWIPGGIEFMASGGRCYATSVLSNLGRVLVETPNPWQDGRLVSGNLLLEAIESAPPVRPHTHTSLTCLFYDGRLSVIQNYDRHHFTPAAAEALLQVTIDQLRETATAGKLIRGQSAAIIAQPTGEYASPVVPAQRNG
ncbi:MAG: hypothetical protein AB7U73_21750 [Pirellulales bacterium]